MSDRKHMKKVREKRIAGLAIQIKKHEAKIKNEQGEKDTTHAYWQKEIDEKFGRQKEEDEEYLDEHE